MPQADQPARPDYASGPAPEMAGCFINHANSPAGRDPAHGAVCPEMPYCPIILLALI
jgi:hypothetical protein